MDGQKLSGAKLANWIAQQRLEKFPRKADLHSLVVSESRTWITAVVNHRDTVAHFRDLPNFEDLRVRLNNASRTIDPSQILRPTMPDGTPLLSFVDDLRRRLGEFVNVSLRMLPNVNVTILNGG